MIQTWQLYALLSAVTAALVAIFAKKGFDISAGIDSTIATTIRSLIMALMLISFSASLGKIKMIFDVNIKSLLFIALSALAGACSWLFYFYAIQKAPEFHMPTVAAIDRLSVVFVLIFSILILKEPFSLTTFIGILFWVIGTIFLAIR